MNQNEQMREALRLLSEIHPGNMTPMAEESWKNATVLIEQVLAKKPSKLVRLTPSELLEAYSKGRENHGSNVRHAIHISGLEAVQNAIMDALETKNGGNENE